MPDELSDLDKRILLSFVRERKFNETIVRDLESLALPSITKRVSESSNPHSPSLESFTSAMEALERRNLIFRYPHKIDNSFHYCVSKIGEDEIKKVWKDRYATDF